MARSHSALLADCDGSGQSGPLASVVMAIRPEGCPKISPILCSSPKLWSLGLHFMFALLNTAHVMFMSRIRPRRPPRSVRYKILRTKDQVLVPEIVLGPLNAWYLCSFLEAAHGDSDNPNHGLFSTVFVFVFVLQKSELEKNI